LSEVTVLLIENGPIKVIGGVSLVDDITGEPIPGGERDPIFLCRCGGSSNKPFCDARHKRNGFQGASVAVGAAAE
jgi:CDGSH-type Zn-finger protein